MNETIGAKGGHNDLLKTNKIKKLKKEKEQEKNLEKKINKQQNIKRIGVLPLIIPELLYDTLKKSSLVENKKQIKNKITEKENEERKKTQTTYNPQEKNQQEEKNKIITNKTVSNVSDKKENNLKEIFNELPDNGKKELEKIEKYKIIETYEKELKELRYQLKKIAYNYYVLELEEKNIYNKKELDNFMEKLNIIIYKIELLKRKLNKIDLSKYDQNYINFLIENEIKSIQKGELIKGLKEKDQQLYKLVSDKIEELKYKHKKLSIKTKEKKDFLEINGKNFNKLKSHNIAYKRFNDEIKMFQKEQEKLIKELNIKLENATSIEEEVEVKLNIANLRIKKLLSIITLGSLIPGAKTALGMTLLATFGISAMKDLKEPYIVNKIKIYKVKDYSYSLETIINKLDFNINEIYKTKKNIKQTMKDFQNEYKDYIEINPKCKDILNSMQKIVYELDSKEYDLERMKLQEEKKLEDNNKKVKTLHNKSI